MLILLQYFLLQQKDYIIFLEAIGFLGLALVTYFISNKEKEEVFKLPWLFMGLFGLFHGIEEVVDVTSYFVPHLPVQQVTENILVVIYCGFLLEFIRISVETIYKSKISLWNYGFAIFGGGILVGVFGIDLVVNIFRIIIVSLGGVISSFLIYKFADFKKEKKANSCYLYLFLSLYSFLNIIKTVLGDNIILITFEALMAMAIFFASAHYFRKSLSDNISVEKMYGKWWNNTLQFLVILLLVMGLVGVNFIDGIAERYLSLLIMLLIILMISYMLFIRALHKNEAYLNSLIINGISDLIALFKVEIPYQDYRLLMTNTAFLHYTAFLKESPNGKNITEIFDEEVVLKIVEQLNCVSRDKKPLRIEQVFINAIFDSKYTPILDGTGICTHILVSATDITDKSKRQTELLKMENLESLGLLAGGLAHDFNNFLMIILGNISLIKMNSSKENEIHQLANEVEIASLQAKGLTQQLLAFSKGETPVKETTSIADIITETVSFILRGSNVKYEYEIMEDLWSSEVDRAQISQVINNLIINASQAMPDGGVVKIRAENITINERKYIKIEVEDHGMGIPEEHFVKMFNPYFTTKEKGNGLGLATVYNIIKKHDGDISVASKVGKGTKFTVFLPANEEKIDQMIYQREISINKYSGKILVMDDDEAIRNLVRNILTVAGYQVAVAVDGEQVIHEYKTAFEQGEVFDAVIMDLTIRGGSGGKEAMDELIKIDPSVKAIVSSGYANDLVLTNYKSYGFKGVAAKPYKIEELLELLGRIIKL